MRPYEVIVILRSSLEEAEVQAVVNRSTALVTGAGGTVNRVDKWGRRRLAYEIDHQAEGYYVLVEATAEPEQMTELDRVLGLADEVVRHKIVRQPEGPAGRTLPASAVANIPAAGPRSE